ncbi:hypothetical protein ABVK25_005519 [Lepraria finkii]|uniref:Uncharacterized protein n=1 Tax=Lepraria finkii TaxID=1340010 RepID=A0ABR4BAD4_9LECA
MKLFTVSAALLLAALDLASATPAQPLARQAVVVTLEGAGPNPPSYTLTPSFDGSTFTIDNPLSVSHINVNTAEGICTFHGIDGANTTIISEGTEDVGPPQVQVSGRCCAFSCIGFPINCCG